MDPRHRAIIVDVDGTVADMSNNRTAYEWDKVHLDIPRMEIINLVKMFHPTHHIIVVSGRDDICQEATIEWLKRFNVINDDLPHGWSIFMRPHKNYEKDALIKKGIYNEYIAQSYKVDYVFDDRNQVVDMWRNDLGLTCLQVNYGNF